jgi:hypothetical protein
MAMQPPQGLMLFEHGITLRQQAVEQQQQQQHAAEQLLPRLAAVLASSRVTQANYLGVAYCVPLPSSWQRMCMRG